MRCKTGIDFGQSHSVVKPVVCTGEKEKQIILNSERFFFFIWAEEQEAWQGKKGGRTGTRWRSPLPAGSLGDGGRHKIRATGRQCNERSKNYFFLESWHISSICGETGNRQKKMPLHDLLIRLFAFFVLSANCANNHPACETQWRHFPLFPAIRGLFSSDHYMLLRGRTICFPEDASRKRSALMPKTGGRRGGKNSCSSLKSLPRRMRVTQSVSERTEQRLVSKPSVQLWGG